MFKDKLYPIHCLTVLFTLLLLVGCSGDSDSQREYDAKEIDKVSIERFEKELFPIQSTNASNALGELKKKYGEFYFYYAQDMLAMPFEGDSLFLKPMQMLLAYKPFQTLFHTTDSFFKDLSPEETALTNAMGIYAAQFPTYKIPSFITFISEFGYANVTFEGKVGIGLDMYMNERFSDFYHSLEFPEFMIRKLNRKYIVPNAIRSLGFSKFDGQIAGDKRFLANMIFEGKVRYFMKALLPEIHDSIIMGYTPSQLDWAKANEGEIWAHYAEKDLLYNVEQNKYMRYFNDGPFTSADGVPQESSPMIGIWSGWKIVQAYMRENPDVSLKQLMEEKDFEKILRLSKYQPEP